MSILGEFRENQVFWVALTAWFIAQTLKGIICLIKTKRIDFRRFIGAGGMPSSHSAFVTSLAYCIGETEGWSSGIAALALVFAFIVMYDAAGVRLAASKQAKTLNQIIDELFEAGTFHQERLKELLGHTPFEVMIGAILGLVVSIYLLR
ncbi:MAG TPA: divergent PAP2 family protein [Bacillota bacterium]|nr:divergent PAP2 family protein [Bacillota bacterium]